MIRWLKRAERAFPALGKVLRRIRNDRAERALAWSTVPQSDIQILGGSWLAAGADHEPHELALFRAMLDEVDTVIDVGANSGVYSCIAAAAGKAVFAFEPMPQNMRVLTRTIERNGLADKIEVFPVALSDTVGIACLYGRGQGASLVEGWAGQPSYDAIRVPTHRLDALLGQRLGHKRILLKIDVEGAELKVLEGGEALLGRCECIMLENGLTSNVPGGRNPAFVRVFEVLEERGFDCRAAEQGASKITPADARGWADAGKVPFDTLNWVFQRRRPLN